jgi:hypothetical protein
MKILPVGTELFHAEGQTDKWMDAQIDMTKLAAIQRLQTDALVHTGTSVGSLVICNSL